MSNFFKRGLMVVFILLIIYFIYFSVSSCLKSKFPKFKPNKCPDYYDIAKCDPNGLFKKGKCCVLRDTKNMNLSNENKKYYKKIEGNFCNKKEIKYYPKRDYNNFYMKKELCEWSKKNEAYGCFVPWDGITNGLREDGRPYC